MDRPSPFGYTPTPATQPYRAQPSQTRQPGPALAAMQRGKTMYGQHPSDVQRQLQSAKPGSLWWHILSLSATNPKLLGR